MCRQELRHQSTHRWLRGMWTTFRNAAKGPVLETALCGRGLNREKMERGSKGESLEAARQGPLSTASGRSASQRARRLPARKIQPSKWQAKHVPGPQRRGSPWSRKQSVGSTLPSHRPNPRPLYRRAFVACLVSKYTRKHVNGE